MGADAKTVDVLAVLDTVDACLHQLKMDPDVKAMHIARFTQARAAIAELIEAAKDGCQMLDDLNSAHGADSVQVVVDRLDAALLACGGAK